MPWSSSRRRAQLPPDWKRRRREVLERDGHACRLCGEPATDVDHIGDRHDHRKSNLQSLCDRHHKVKTQVEAAAARASKATRRRPPERHPGLL